jgi:PAS domain S-box-containing protein
VVLDALRASEERYRSFFEEDINGHYLATAEGQILACNPAFLRILGFDSTEEALASNMTSLHVNPEGRGTILELVRATGRAELREWEMRRRDGVSLHVIKNVVGVFDDAGDLVRMRGFIVDITDRKLLEEQLRQSQKMEAVGRLAGGIAHDFNNMLMVIGGFAAFLEGEVEQGGDAAECVAEIQKASGRAAQLTQQLLAFGRKQVLQPKVVDINGAVRDASRMLRRLIPENIEIESRLDPRAGQVRVDPTQMYQVLLNLAANARDAMPDGGRVLIRTTHQTIGERHQGRYPFVLQQGTYVKLVVQDSGVGMEKETISHIFEPFFTTKPQGEGTGLGLSTVDGIISQSGGYIWAESQPGKGSTFTILLPRETEPQAVGGESVKADSPCEASGTVLLAEDEEMVRRLVSRTLRKAGYTVLEARSGAEALRIYEEHKGAVDILVTDVIMPNMGGRALADALRVQQPQLPVVLMSGYGGDALVEEESLPAGMAFLAKPFEPAALMEIMTAISARVHVACDAPT